MKKWITRTLGIFLLWLEGIGILDNIILAINNIGIKSNLVPGMIMRRVMEVAQSGDMILIRAYGESSTLLIGQGYTHSAIRCKVKKHIIDATGKKGLAKRDILELFQGISCIAVLRLKDWTEDEMHRLMARTEHYEAKKIPYDYGYDSNKEEMYCSEFLYHCINDIRPGLLNLRERFGIQTITPEDLYKARRVFDLVFEYKVDEN